MNKDNKKLSYLVVVAHPDDEVLGAGATLLKLSDAGHSVSICVLSGTVDARSNRPEIKQLNSDIENALKIIGVNEVIMGSFPNIAFNIEKHLDLVRFIENAIVKTSADVVITHHPADLNNDHLHTSIACQAATKLFQRRNDIKPIRELLFMEIPSSTEWSLNTGMRQFNPNLFVEVGLDRIDIKIKALHAYSGVMREYPHPRSDEAIKGLALYRGSQAGLMYAEAFESVFRRIEIKSDL